MPRNDRVRNYGECHELNLEERIPREREYEAM